MKFFSWTRVEKHISGRQHPSCQVSLLCVKKNTEKSQTCVLKWSFHQPLVRRKATNEDTGSCIYSFLAEETAIFVPALKSDTINALMNFSFVANFDWTCAYSSSWLLKTLPHLDLRRVSEIFTKVSGFPHRSCPRPLGNMVSSIDVLPLGHRLHGQKVFSPNQFQLANTQKSFFWADHTLSLRSILVLSCLQWPRVLTPFPQRQINHDDQFMMTATVHLQRDVGPDHRLIQFRTIDLRPVVADVEVFSHSLGLQCLQRTQQIHALQNVTDISLAGKIHTLTPWLL